MVIKLYEISNSRGDSQSVTLSTTMLLPFLFYPLLSGKREKGEQIIQNGLHYCGTLLFIS